MYIVYVTGHRKASQDHRHREQRLQYVVGGGGGGGDDGKASAVKVRGHGRAAQLKISADWSAAHIRPANILARWNFDNFYFLFRLLDRPIV